MRVKVAMPAVRQSRSKLTLTCSQASSTIAVGTAAGDVVGIFMVFLESAPARRSQGSLAIVLLVIDRFLKAS
jgi:hypothetical protein